MNGWGIDAVGVASHFKTYNLSLCCSISEKVSHTKCISFLLVCLVVLSAVFQLLQWSCQHVTMVFYEESSFGLCALGFFWVVFFTVFCH